MSFYTSLIFYRPCQPPIITGSDLSKFVADVQKLGILDTEPDFRAELKFGDRINQDDKPAYWDEPLDELGIVNACREIEWDVEEQFRSLDQLIARLAREKRSIYRGFLPLGYATEDVSDYLRRPESPDNDLPLLLGSVSMELGPVELHCLGLTEFLYVGYIGVSFSGMGYLFPWTFSGLVERAEAHPKIQELMGLCRKTWPVPREKPDRRIQSLREQYKELWPYSRFDLEWDWYWGLAETG